jgi:hypothetical protein
MWISSQTSVSLSRRQWLGAAAGAFSFLCLTRTGFGASDFWNKKSPGDWSSEELLVLTTRSPWAQSARVEFKARGGGETNTRGGREVDRGNGISVGGAPGAPGGRGRGGGGQNTGGTREERPRISETEIIVRWESAQPLLDGLRYPMPEDFADHYVIGIGNLPEPQRIQRRSGDDVRVSEEDILQQLQSGASLKAKGKESVGAGVVRRMRKGSVVLFGFSKELLPLGPSDKDILFTLNTEQFAVKAKFDPKEMVYRGQLAL